MASISKTTRDHDVIRQWAEERGGKPAHVTGTGSGEDIGILRLEFPGATGSNDASLEPITWDQFFEKFDERGLALLYQEETAEGAKSNFNKLVSGETADAADESGHSATAKRRPRAPGAAKKTPTSAKGSASPAKTAVSKKTAGNVGKSAPVKKAAAKKSTAKKTPAKKAAAKKTGAKKTAAANRTMGRPVKKAAKKSAGGKNSRGAAKTAGRKAAVKKTAAKGRGGARKMAGRSRR